MRCTRSRGSRGFQCLVCLPRPGERGRYPTKVNDSSSDYDFEAAAFARAGEYARLEVPIADAMPSQAFVNKWVKPFYLTNLVYKYDTFESNFRLIAQEIDDALITGLLAQRNWRPRITAAYFVAINQLETHCDHIGKLLLRSDVCFAGGGYALALARINSSDSIDYLTKYLHHYLRRPDLGFDQADVLGAVKYCDKLNQTSKLDDLRPLWSDFNAGRNSDVSIADATDWFDQKMNSILNLAQIVG